MKKYNLIILLIIFFSNIFGENLLVNDSQIQSFEKVSKQIYKSIQEFPKEIKRVSFFLFDVDSEKFSKGMADYYQNKIEEIFIKNTDIDVINSLELKDLNSKKFSPKTRTELLWKLGRKLNVDAFVSGNITKSKKGKLIITIKLIQSANSRLIWSNTYIEDAEKTQEEDFAKEIAFSDDIYEDKLLGVNNWVGKLATEFMLDFSLIDKAKKNNQEIANSGLLTKYYLGVAYYTYKAKSELYKNDYYKASLGFAISSAKDDKSEKIDFENKNSIICILTGIEYMRDLIRINSPLEGDFIKGYIKLFAGKYISNFKKGIIDINFGAKAEIIKNLDFAVGVKYILLGDELINSDNDELKLKGLGYETNISYRF